MKVTLGNLALEKYYPHSPVHHAGAHEPGTEAMDAAVEAGTPPDPLISKAGLKSLTPATEPLQRAPIPHDATRAAEVAAATKAVSQKDMSHSTDDMPAAAPAGRVTLQHDTRMQDASEAIAAGAVQHAAPEQVIANMQAAQSTQPGAQHNAQGHAGDEADDQAQHLMQASRQPEGADHATADTVMQEASQPSHAQQAALVCADTCMQDAVDAADGGNNNSHCADPGMQDASQPDEGTQRSTRATDKIMGVQSAAQTPLGQEDCMPTQEDALSADMTDLQPVNRVTRQACMAPEAAAALRYNAMQSEAFMAGVGGDLAPHKTMRPSSAGTVMVDLQPTPLAAETLARSASAPLLSKGSSDAIPRETVAPVEQRTAVPEGGNEPGAN